MRRQIFRSDEIPLRRRCQSSAVLVIVVRLSWAAPNIIDMRMGAHGFAVVRAEV
jgi:hypothetical protein